MSPTTAPTAVTKAMVQSYASQNSWGLNPDPAIFLVELASVDKTECSPGIPGDRVSVPSTSNYQINFMKYIFFPTLTAQACYPTST
jgi:hypothetical protein